MSRNEPHLTYYRIPYDLRKTNDICRKCEERIGPGDTYISTQDKARLWHEGCAPYVTRSALAVIKDYARGNKNNH